MDAGAAIRSVRHAAAVDRSPVVHVLRETPRAEAPRPKLIDRLRHAVRARHYSRRTEKAYVHWTKRYIFFHGKRHPAEMGAAEVTAFLTALAVRERVAASTQNQALNALLFLYREILGVELPWLDDLVRAKRPQHLPTVLTRDEVRAVLERVDGVPRLIALLLYGSGLRLLECCRLRVKDLDFAANQITIRDGKGGKDRMTMFPGAVKTDLAKHLERVRALHQRDLRHNAGWVELPWALARKYPNAGREWPCPQEGDVSHLPPLLCDASVGGRARHPHSAGATRPQRCEHDDDLHPRPEPRPSSRAEPGGSDVPLMTRPRYTAAPRKIAREPPLAALRSIFAIPKRTRAHLISRAPGATLRRVQCSPCYVVQDRKVRRRKDAAELGEPRPVLQGGRQWCHYAA
jgi:hypothetical protein